MQRNQLMALMLFLLAFPAANAAGAAPEPARAASSAGCAESTDYEQAARDLQVETMQAERASVPPPEDSLHALAECYARLHDITGQMWALEKLVTYFPRPGYWAELISRTQERKDFGERLALDVLRLRKATKTLDGARDYLEIVALSTKAGYPAEAKVALEEGFARGILGTGLRGAQHRELRARVSRETIEARRLAHNPEEQQRATDAKSGEALLALGYAHVTLGEYAQGLQLMKQGLRKGGIDRPQDAMMRLGIAYLLAGQQSQALVTLASVTGAHGAADLGHLWYLYALHDSM